MSFKNDRANTQFARGEVFRKLHKDRLLFVIPNAWDPGSARLLTDMHFSALTAKVEGSLPEYGPEFILRRNEVLINAHKIVSATHLPVAADLENGYGDTPEICMETILHAARAGLVGGSISDFTGKSEKPVYDFSCAVERIIASVDAARSLPFYFTVTAVAENHLHGKPDLDDTIKRLVAYANAGADVLFAPGFQTSEEISAIVNAVSPRSVNVLMRLSDSDLMTKELMKLGVSRVSIGSPATIGAPGNFYKDVLQIKE